ncbi:hypothetical protein Bca4012_075558 [Brassica carinata]
MQLSFDEQKLQLKLHSLEKRQLVRASSIAAKSWEATFSSPTTTKPDARFSIRVTPQWSFA